MYSDSIVPFRIRIGVTGHRKLSDEFKLRQCIDSILSTQIFKAFKEDEYEKIRMAENTPVTYTVVSPLAEGADRLVAQAIIQKGGRLESLLPMPREEYEKDFPTPESLREFNELLAKSHRVVTTECGVLPTDAEYRQHAYLRVGQETLNCCDILIALWDGNPSRGIGGTAHVVALAIDQKKPVFIVSTSQPGTLELKNEGVLNADFIAELERFNSVSITAAELAAQCEKDFADIFPSHEARSIPEPFKKIVEKFLIPPYCRASKISAGYQKRYKRTGKLGYIFSTLSVTLMAIAVICAKQPLFSIPGYIAELCLLISLYLMIHRAEHARIHSGWLESRALAERLRTVFYFTACGESPDAVLKGHIIYHRSYNWVDHAYNEIISTLPMSTRPKMPELGYCREFIDTTWVQGQIDYHTENNEKLSRNNDNLKKWGIWCFELAIGISLIHLGFAIFGSATGHHPEGWLLVFEEVLSVIAITLPAGGAAFGGYRSLLEQSRIAARSKAMMNHLSHLRKEACTEDSDKFRQYLECIQEIMLIESEDWLALMEHAELERIA